ncbi:MAG: hypothetical protein A2632_03025 [Candidatus Pacebacteria bacterium RIFCSPHIGHO2_01_FULL_46_16]|nr:MAG: hypothetical protein A2632_03025 [Candidatus Pacebacteria bacterium RIFCSPHIGHO2_01_FULL_46_16]OGJ20961.1 MAG: hypothetical protein A3J60_00735 [Candidatus Pacebacteria bacterium RIFCSPHIGHO2_02_FULL_46_9]OGJ38960.1 MAG: hypothetical protein A3A82_02340 [Candidatus Pacebacteria bacterium RIFCSPLOWO2_01_FULL_47_12]
MKFAILSDSHDRWDLLDTAVTMANEANCAVLLHAGDLVGLAGIDVLAKFVGDVYFIWGNNETEQKTFADSMGAFDNLHLAGGTLDTTIGVTTVFMNHYPEVAQAAFSLEIHDLVVHGHSHEYQVKKLDKRFLINPGELCGRKTGVSTFVTFDAEEKSVERMELGL